MEPEGGVCMSTLSFKAFCIEYYAAHIGRPGNEIYALFDRTGLLKLLDEDYEDLHGMSMEYLMQFLTGIWRAQHDFVPRKHSGGAAAAHSQI